jgi:hypothetical protein
MKNTILSYKIITSKECKSFEEPIADAFKNIKQYMQAHSAWLYIDGQPKKIEELRKAKSIAITITIIAG